MPFKRCNSEHGRYWSHCLHDAGERKVTANSSCVIRPKNKLVTVRQCCRCMAEYEYAYEHPGGW